MNNKRSGLLIIISAPSGTGKSTVCRALLQRIQHLKESVSYTTRPARKGEKDGVNYHFVSRETFQKMKEKDEFAEWAEVHGEWYGTSKSILKKILSLGDDVLLEIDVQGAINLKRLYPDSVTIFLAPPSMEVLALRLRSRGSETEEAIQRRLVRAADEMKFMNRYDFTVINEDLPDAVVELEEIILRKRRVRA